jgi:hypothetical protein
MAEGDADGLAPLTGGRITRVALGPCGVGVGDAPPKVGGGVLGAGRPGSSVGTGVGVGVGVGSGGQTLSGAGSMGRTTSLVSVTSPSSC